MVAVPVVAATGAVQLGPAAIPAVVAVAATVHPGVLVGATAVAADVLLCLCTAQVAVLHLSSDHASLVVAVVEHAPPWLQLYTEQ